MTHWKQTTKQTAER